MHVELNLRSVSIARCAVAALFLGCVPCLAQTPPPAEVAPRVVRERALTPATRDLRTDVVRALDPHGRVMLDARKIAGNSAAGAGGFVAADLAGNAVPIEAMAGSTVAVASRADQWVVVRPVTIPTQSMQRGVQWLPGVCIAPAATPGGAKDVLSSYADFATVPVAWDTAIDAYRVQGAVGVARNGDLAQGGSIGRDATIKVQFLGVSAAPPVEFVVQDLGIGGEHEFASVFRGTDVPKPTLVVRSNLGAEQPYLLDVRPRVELTPRRNPMLGLGLDEIEITVECVEAHGALVALGGTSPVTLRCSSGRDDGADRLAVSAAEPRAQFRFRSTWIGPARIIATTRTPSGEIVGSVLIQQVVPWPQMLTALIGGGAGGFARRFVRGARRRAAARRIVEGLLVGLVAFVAGVLGVGWMDLPPVIVSTVAGAFLTAVLAGFAGVVVLERLSQPKGGSAAADR
jgi:hypothetical protein